MDGDFYQLLEMDLGCFLRMVTEMKVKTSIWQRGNRVQGFLWMGMEWR